MNVPHVKRLIGQCDDQKELAEIIKAAKDRQTLLAQRLFSKFCAEAWARVKALPKGTVLYCCASGTFIGGPLQRGDSMTVDGVQPRVKRLWVTLANGKPLWFGYAGIHRYNLRTEPPEAPIPIEERRMVDAISGSLAEIKDI